MGVAQRRAGWAMAAVAVVLVGGCSRSGTDARASRAASRPGRGTNAPATGAGAAAGPAATGRQVVFTVDVTMTTDHVAEVGAKAEKLVADAGGLVFGRQSTSTGGAERIALVLKVPSDRLDSTMAGIRALGRVASDARTADDVSAKVVDLDARISAATASLARVRALVGNATSIAEVTSVDGEITRRETELEQMLGQRRQLGQQVELATIDLTIERPTPQLAASVDDRLRAVPGVGRALSGSMHAIVVVLRVLGAGVGYALPFGVVFGLPVLVATRLRKRPRRRAVA